MTGDRWHQVTEIFHAAAKLPDHEARDAYLGDACADDPALRAEVEALLAAQDEAGAFGEAPLGTEPFATSGLPPGTRLGPHEILRLIGAGGMGEVYEARDTRLDRIVAVKVLPAELGSDPERRARFVREAKTIAQLNHPHICTLHDVGEAPASDAAGVAMSGPSRPYLVMELVEGETLAARLARAGPVPLAQALRIGAEVAEALAAAHRHGIVHRDLKPANVMLTKSGAKLLDFGLAKLRAHGERPVVEMTATGSTRSAPLTGRGVILGTLPYMAPEQLAGETVDARTDLWALGTLLYEMLTGARAFAGDSSASLIGAILEREPAPLAEGQPLTPPALDRLVRKCLAKAPDDRWESAHDVADELRWIAQAGAGETASEANERHPRQWAVPLVVVAAAVAAVAVFWPREQPPASPQVVRSFLGVSPAEDLFGGRYPTTFGPTLAGTRTALAWTPDGQALVFVGRPSHASPVRRLYLRALDSTEARAIEGTEQAIAPVVSPDGAWVAFWTSLSTSIRKTPLAGGPVVEVASGIGFPPRGIVWHPNGDLIFGQEKGGLRAAGADGVVRTLTTLEEGELVHSLPCVLADGSVLFTVRKREFTWGDEEIVAYVPSTGERKTLLRDAADARYVPETGHLVFMRKGVLHAVGFDAERLETRGAVVPVEGEVAQALTDTNTINVTGAGQYAVSSNGTLAWVRSPEVAPQRQGRLVAVDRHGNVSPLRAPVNAYGPVVRVSPDGRHLAVAIRTLTEVSLWIYDREQPDHLTPLVREGEVGSFVWSGDGSALVFNWLKDGTRSLAQQVADGSRPPEVVLNEPGGSVSSSTPDGKHVAVVNEEPGADIGIVSLAESGASLTTWLQTPDKEESPEFSPNGRWMAYVSNMSGTDQVYVRPYPGPGSEILVPESSLMPAWHPDGSALFFEGPPLPGSGPARRQMMSVHLSAEGRPTLTERLFEFAPVDLVMTCRPVRCHDVDPTGQFFYTIQYTEPWTDSAPVTRIDIIQNWFEELKAKVPVR